MESLPPEMVKEISQHLTPRDLASCTAVSRRWREVFNEDRLWKPHCDPSLVEPLQKTPSVVDPRFPFPEEETSTLTAISHWRLAFLRQHHLWNNWRKGNHKKDILKDHNKFRSDFLSNTHIVTWLVDRMEIWDVSTVPATLIISKNLEGLVYCQVYRTNRILVSHRDSVKTFYVDPLNEHVIELVHDISVDFHEQTDWYKREPLNCVNGSIYVHVNPGGLTLDVIDLEKGMKVKTESCPVKSKENQNATIIGLKSSPNSDYVVVMVHVPWSDKQFPCYTYSVGRLSFSSGPIVKHSSCFFSPYAINGDHLALTKWRSLEIYNCLTSELVTVESSSDHYGHIHVFNECFLCKVSDRNFETWLEMFSLTSKTWTTVSHPSFSGRFSLTIINNKFIKCSDVDNKFVWQASGQTLRLSDIPDICGDKINESFTRGISNPTNEKCVYYYW